IAFFFQAEDGIRDGHVTGVQTCALPISVSIERKARIHGVPPRRRAFLSIETALAAARRAVCHFAGPCGGVEVPNAPYRKTNVGRSEERRVGKGYSRWRSGLW